MEYEATTNAAAAAESTMYDMPAENGASQEQADNAEQGNAAEQSTEESSGTPAQEPAAQQNQAQPQNQTPAAEAKPGPNADFAARRAAAEMQQRAEERVFQQLTGGMVNPKTGKPFTSMQEFAGFKQTLQLNAMAKQAGIPNEKAESLAPLMESAKQLALEEIKNSPEYMAQQEALTQMQQAAQQRVFSDDLASIKKAYPDEAAAQVTDLGMDFMKLRAAGVDAIVAYEAVRKATAAKTPTTPTTGDVQTNAGNNNPGFFTSEQVDRMSDAEIAKNLEKILESQKHWK